MDMAQASGTLEKLNEIYDREMEYMQGAIDDLKAQLKTWKNKIQQYDKFLNVKVHIPQELRIRSGGTERHSASN